jgi:hypothetical protein
MDVTYVLSTVNFCMQSSTYCPRSTPKASKSSPTFSLSTAIHASEVGFYDEVTPPRHRFEVRLEFRDLNISQLLNAIA